MKRILGAGVVFVLTFAFGLLVGTTRDTVELKTQPDAERSSAAREGSVANRFPVDPPAPEKAPESNVEFRGLDPFEFDFTDSNDLIDVLERDGVYRESEVLAKTGETWLTLFERRGKYILEPTKARVKQTRTISFPGDEYDVHLSFDSPGRPIFAVRTKFKLKPGLVTTLYHRPSEKEIIRRNLPIGPMNAGYKREFNLNESWYTLRVSRGETLDGNILGVLVLEHEGVSQIVARNYDETIGELFWVGDLDGDKKLDLYVDGFNEKGAFITELYLSSAAEPGMLVKRVATFAAGGC